MVLVSAVGATVTPGAATVISATKGSSIYLIAPAAIVLTAATLLGPSSGKASLYIRGAAVTLPATIDPAKFDIVADYPGTKTLTVAGLLMPALKLSGGATTLATVTAVSGAISGDGNLILPAGLSSVSSDISKLTGTITTGAATTFATAPQRVSMLHGVTISGNGTVKKVTVGAAALTLTANEDITIEELDINSRALFNLSPASGKTITIKKLTWTVGSSSVVDVLGAGKVIVGGASGYDGNFTTSGGGTITVK